MRVLFFGAQLQGQEMRPGGEAELQCNPVFFLPARAVHSEPGSAFTRAVDSVGQQTVSKSQCCLSGGIITIRCANADSVSLALSGIDGLGQRHYALAAGWLIALIKLPPKPPMRQTEHTNAGACQPAGTSGRRKPL